MFKRISSLVIMIAMLVTLLPNVYAAEVVVTKSAYADISLADLDGSSVTSWKVEAGKLGYTGPNQHYWYDNIDFGDRGPINAELSMACSKNYAKGVITIRLDSRTGPVIAEFPVEETFKDTSSFSLKTMKLDLDVDVTGVHSVYMHTQCNAGDFYTLRFTEAPDPSKLFVEYDDNASVFSDVTNHKYRYDVNFVTGLGINLADEGAEKLYPDHYMTRGKFADVILDIVGDDGIKAERAFSDVPEDHPYYDSINKIAALGYMRGVGDGKFLPGNYITVQDAAVCAINLLTYSRIAESEGGYSSGYMNIAQKEDLLKGLNGVTHLTNGAAARFVKNIIRAEYYEITSFSANGEAIYNRVADGILSKTRNIFRGTGLIEGNSLSLVNSPNTNIPGNAVLINGEVFTTGTTSAKAMLGYECEYFYTDKDGEKTLIQCLPVEKISKTIIDSSEYDITKITSSEVVYGKKHIGENKTLDLGQCHIIYNNVNLDRPLSDVITYPFRGKVIYVENQNGTNVLFIENYQNIVLGGFNEVTGALTDKVTGEVIDISDMNFFLTLNGEGALPTSAFMKDVSFGMLYISKNRNGDITARLIADTNAVSGKVESMDSNGTVVINGTEYAVDANAVSSLGLAQITAGLTATFSYNSYNEIVYYEIVDNDGLQIGYLVNWGVNNPGKFSEECYVRIIGRDNVLNAYVFAENAKIDGTRYRSDDDKTQAIDVAAENAPVRYSLDENGDINILDTVIQKSGTVRGSDSDDMLILSSETTTNDLVWTAGWSAFMDKSDSFRMKMVSDSDTVAFSTYGPEEDWAFTTLASLSEISFNGKGYSSDKNENVIDVLVTSRKPGSGSSRVVTFADKSMVLNEDDEICIKMTCYSGNVAYEYIIEKETVKNQINVLKKGDLFSMVDGGDTIEEDIKVILFADGSEKRAYVGGELAAALYYTDSAKLGLSGNGCDSWGYTAGVVTEKFGDFAEIKLIGGSSTEPVYAYYKLNTSSIFVTKYTSENDYIEAGVVGTDIQVGDIVCVTMNQKSIKGIHTITDSALVDKID